MTTVETYSSGYYLVPHASVVEYGGDRVVVPNDMFDYFRGYVNDPILRLSDGHYRAYGEWGIPPEVIAVPDDVTHYQTDEVFLTRNEAAADKFMMEDRG